MAAGDLALNVIVGAQMAGSVQQVMNQLQQAFQNLSQGDILGALGNAAEAVGTTLLTAAQDAGNFQQQLTMLSTSAGESANNLQAVGQGILKISTDTGTSTTQLTQAMYYIESSGQHGAAALQELTTAAEGAKTENADLTTVTNALVTVMTDYHLPVEDSTAAMNGLIATVQNGRTNLQTLSSSMGQVLPAASSLGVAFPQVAGAMDAMTNAGVPARMAAMELAHFFLALEAPSAVAEKSMASVGLTAQQLRDDLVSKGLPDALQTIEDHVGKTFPQGSIAYTDAIKNITGGLMGFKVNASLTGDELPILEKDIQNVSNAMNSGSNQVMGFAQVQDTFNFKIAQAQAAFNALMITLGQQLLPIFSQIIGWVTSVVEGFTNWESQTHFVQTALQDLVSALQTVFTWAQQLYNYLANIWAEIAPIFDQFIQNASVWGNNFIVGFINGMAPAVQQLINYVEQVAQEIANYLGFQSPTKKGPGTKLNEWGVGMMTGLAQGIIDSIPAVSAAVNEAATELQTISAKGATSLQAAGKASATYQDTSMGDTMQATVTPMKAIPQQMPDQMKDTGTSSATALTKALSTGVQQGVGTVQTAVNTIAATTDTACKAAAATSKCVSDNLTTHTAAATKAKAPAVKAAAQHVGNQTNAAADAALKAAEAAHKALTTNLAKKVQTGAPAVQGAASNLSDMIKKPLDQVPPATNKVSTAFQNMGHGASLASKDINTSLTGLPKLLQDIESGLKTFGQQIVQFFTPAAQAVQRLMQALGDLLSAAVKPIIVGIGDLVKGFVQFTQGIAKIFADVNEATIAGQIFSRLLEILVDSVAAVVKALAQALGPAIAAIVRVITTQVAPAFGHLITSMAPLLPAVQILAGVVGGVLIAILIALAAIIVGLVQGFANLLAGIAQAIAGIVQVISGILQIINGALTVIIGYFTNNQKEIQDGQKIFAQGLQDIWTGLGNTIMGILNGLWGFISGIFDGIYNTVTDAIKNLSDELVGHSLIPEMVTAIEDVFSNFGVWIKNILQQYFDDFITYWTNIGTEVQRLVQTLWAYVQAIFQEAWTKFIEPSLVATGTAFLNWWNNEIKQWQTLATALWKVVTDIFKGAWNQLLPDLTALGQDFLNWFTTEATNFGTWAGNLMKMFGQGINTGITTFLQPAINAAAQAIQNVLGIFSPAKTGPLSTADQWMPNMMKMMASGIHGGTPSITNGVNNMASGVQNSMSDMTSNVGNSAAQMKEQLQSVGQDISNMQGQVSAAINQAKAQMQSATSEITANLTAERSLISQTVGYLANEMNVMGQTIQKVENQANQATSAVNSDLQNTNAAGKAVQVNLDLSNSATKAAWQDYLQAVNSAKATMNAEGMSTAAQAKALQNAIQAGNSAYTAALASGKSQADALEADKNAFNTSIKESEAASGAKGSLQYATASTGSAQTSTGAAQISQQSAQLSGINAVIARAQEFIAGGSAYSSALDAGYSKTQAQTAQTAASAAALSGSRAEVSAGLSQVQQIAANSAANQAYTYAFNAAASKNESFQQAQQAGLGAMQATIKATISQDQAYNAAQSSISAGISAGQAAQQSSASLQDLTNAKQSAQQSMIQAGLSQQQQQAATTAATNAAGQAGIAAYQAGASKQGQMASETAAYTATINATIAKDKAFNSQQSAQQSNTSMQTASTAATQTANFTKTAASGAAQSQVFSQSAQTDSKTVSTTLKTTTVQTNTMQDQVAQAIADAKTIAQEAIAAASSMAAMMGIHSPSKEGPLSDSDKWMPNLIKMFVNGLSGESAQLKNATKITASGVKDAFMEAAQGAGAALISLKQKGDDIYATIAQLTSTGGTPGTAGTPGTIYSANLLGDIPIQGIGTPGIPGTSGSSTTGQTYTVHLDLDGKTIAKTVMKYQQNELRVQGVIRNK